jgi:glycerol-3-phosphate acyltransferase PlsY
MSALGLLLLAYLLGSIPTSYLLARQKGIDLRRFGSGNIGATNLYRAAGFGPALLCTIVDVGKGFVPARFFPLLDGRDVPWLALAYGLAAVLGHVFPLWLRLRGGKGVATGAGVYLALAPLAVGLGALIWLGVVVATRIVSVGSLAAATLLPGLVWLSGHRRDFVFWASLPLAVLVWWTHRSNLRRLVAGREPRVARGRGGVAQGAPGSSPTASEG